MTTALQLRRGTTAQHSSFTGAIGEVTVDTSKKTIVVHDGATAGGVPLLPKTMTDGTANGVAYLNGSKVLTTGSALTFDGTNLGVGTSSPGAKLDVNGRINTNNIFTAVYAANTAYYAQLDSLDANANLKAIGSGAAITFQTGGSEQMRLTSTGLGIGTSIPSAKLDVRGAGYFINAANPTVFLSVDSGLSTGSMYNQFNTSSNVGLSGTYTNHPYAFVTNNTERMRIDSSGNVGIGTSSPSYGIDLQKATSNGSSIRIYNATAGSSFLLQSDTSGVAYVQQQANAALAFATNNSERMRIDSSGNLRIGTTDNAVLGGEKVSIFGAPLGVKTATIECMGLWSYRASGTYVSFYATTSGTSTGNITTNGTNTTYATSSDYRLKENIRPMQNALSVVQQLNPVIYNWKSTGEESQGFIAHELQAVVPDCVTGEKDAVDAEGKPVYQGIDTSFLVATLTKAIQELSAKNDALEARISQLEGN